MEKKTSTPNLIVITVVLILAFLLRFTDLANTPSGFHNDEASFAYNAYSILKTGKDEHGVSFPLFLEAFGDYKLAAYAYTQTIPIKLFGLTEFASRFPAALFGVLTVFVLYLLVKEILGGKNPGRDTKRIAVLSAFLLAISPWHIIASRVGNETSLMLFLILTGVYLLLRSIRTHNLLLFSSSFFLFLSAIFSYRSASVFLPVFLPIFFALAWKNFKFKEKLLSLILITFFVISPSIYIIFSQEGQARNKLVSLFSFPQVQLLLDEQIREEGISANTLVTRLFHNKPLNHTLAIADNYFKHLTANFLIINGGFPLRYSVPQSGVIYWLELPFLTLGIIILALLVLKQKFLLVPLFWFFVAPIPAAITIEDLPNVQRSLLMMPMVSFFTAVGIIFLFNKLKSSKIFPLVFSLFLTIFIFNFSFFLHNLFIHQKIHKNWYRGDGQKEFVKELTKLSFRFDRVFVSQAHGDPYIYLLFYQKYDPLKYQTIRNEKENGLKRIDNFVFVPKDCPFSEKENLETGKTVLFANKGECPLPQNEGKLLTTVYRKDKSPLYHFITPSSSERQ